MDRDTAIRFWRVGNMLSCLGVVQFLVFTTLAMCCYPGGTMWNETAPSYSFYENFLSDLGRVTSWSHKPNWASMFLFNASLVLMALSVLPFFWFLPLHAPDRAGLLRVAAWLGFVSSIALIGIGLTPYDVFARAHNEALVVWLISSVIAVSLHAVALLSSRESPHWYGLLSLGVAAVLIVYAVLAFSALGVPTIQRGLGNEVTSEITGFIFSGIKVRQAATAQKFVVLCDLAWFIIFSWRAARSEHLRPDNRFAELEEAAKEYLRRVGVQPDEPKPRRQKGASKQRRRG